jgi:hypothetical protein
LALITLNQDEAAAVNYGVVELKGKNLFHKKFAIIRDGRIMGGGIIK